MDEVTKNMESANKKFIKNDEIDLIEIAKTIWEGRKFALRIAIIFSIIGFIYAIGTKNEFEASCKLLAESDNESSELNGFSGLAGLAGINLNVDNNNSLNPELYPEITQSIPFLLQIVNEPIYFKKIDSTVSSYQYFNEISNPSFSSYILKYTIELPFLIKSKLFQKKVEDGFTDSSDSRIISLSRNDSKFLKRFKDRIIVSVDSNTGIITLNCSLPDANASAELTDKCLSLLTEYIKNYKISKFQKNLEFIEARHEEAKEQYYLTQNNLALFTDRNRNVITSQAKIELQKLQNEFNLAFDVYKGLATQLEQSKIKVKENTPAFTILEPIKVPIDKSKPKRTQILIFSCFLGFALGLVIYFIRNFFNPLEK